jgi:hypothetical protein
VGVQPTRILRSFPFEERAPYRVFTPHPFHPQQPRQNIVASDRSHVGVPLVSRQHAQQKGPQDILLGRGIAAAVAQGAVRNPLLP